MSASDPFEGDPSDRTSAPLRSAVAWTTATTLAIGLVAFVSAPIVSQSLGASGRGRLVVVQLAPQMLADLSSIGLAFAIVHFGAQRVSSTRTLLVWSLRPLAVGSAVMLVIGQLIVPFVTRGSPEDADLMRWYLLICPIVAYTSVPIEAMRSIGHFKTWNLLALVRGVSWPLTALVAVGVASDPIAFVVVAHLAVSAVILVIAWLVALARTRGFGNLPAVSRDRYVRYGLASAASTIPRSANAKLDQVIMTGLVARDSLGLYAAAVGWSALTVPLMRGLASVTMPHVSSATDSQRVTRVARLMSMAGLIAAVLTVVGIVATYLLFRPLYGEEFEGAVGAAMVLVPAALLLEMNAVLGNVLRSLDRPGLVAVLEVSVMIVATGALVVVLTRSEVLGPALVSLMTYAAATLLYTAVIARRLSVPVSRLLTVRGLALGRSFGRSRVED